MTCPCYLSRPSAGREAVSFHEQISQLEKKGGENQILPFRNGTVNGAIINLIIHCLQHTTSDQPRVRETMNEAGRLGEAMNEAGRLG